MKRDFHLAPPATVSVECFDRGRDVSGNPTAHYLLQWSNGLTGEKCATGHYRTKRREQVGYGDKCSEGAIGILQEYFAGTKWDIVPGSLKDGPHNATCEVTRDYDAESVPVIFRAVKSGEHKGTIDAFFPTLAGTNDPYTCTVYSHIGQHCTGAKDYYRDTRAATDAESESLKRELRGIGYKLDVKKRWTAAHDATRIARLSAQRGES